MNKKIFLLGLVFISILAVAQVGINTVNPQNVFHIDGAQDNPITGIPSLAEQQNDFIVTSTGSVGIGTAFPDPSAAIDMSNKTNMGIILPYVNLADNTQQIGETPNKPGLMIYNGGSTFKKGYYFWDGIEWRSIEDSPSVSAGSATVDCNTVTLDPNVPIQAGMPIANGTVMKVFYTSGNGGSFQGVTLSSVGNPGVTATISSGKLDYGSGHLVFKISGIPTAGQTPPTGINFDLTPLYTANSGITGCANVNIGSTTYADFQQIAVMDFLKFTTDANGAKGFSVEATTPDGLYTFRIFLMHSNQTATATASNNTTQVQWANAQIRNNSTISKTIMWNNSTLYGGYIGQAGYNMIIPVNATTPGRATNPFGGDGDYGNYWYPQTTTYNRPYWGNEGIYQGANQGPEYRFYSWIEQGASKTAYIVTFMAGSNGGQTSTNPAGMKVYIKIEQIKAV